MTKPLHLNEMKLTLITVLIAAILQPVNWNWTLQASKRRWMPSTPASVTRLLMRLSVFVTIININCLSPGPTKTLMVPGWDRK